MSETRLILKKVSTGKETSVTSAMSVGRSEDSVLRLLDGAPSRNHALITPEAGAAFVEDRGSSNGTFVNNQRINAHEKVKLNSGDRLRFDIEEFIFHIETPVPPSEKTVLRVVTADQKPAARVEADRPKNLPGSFADDSPNKTVRVDQKQLQELLKARKNAHPDATPAQGDCPYLSITAGSRAGGRVELTASTLARNQWTIGSQGEREICFDEAGVSALHAKLVHENKTWLLTDEISANGTFVNDKRSLKSFLSDGDRLRFGPVECVFRIPVPAPATLYQKAEGGRGKRVGIILGIAFLVTLAAIVVLFKVLN